MSNPVGLQVTLAGGQPSSLQAIREQHGMTRRALKDRIAAAQAAAGQRPITATVTIRSGEGGFARPSRDLVDFWLAALDLDPHLDVAFTRHSGESDVITAPAIQAKAA
jgi:hypothetical protein